MPETRLKSVLFHGSALTGIGLVASAGGQLLANLLMVALATPSSYADISVLTVAITIAAVAVRLGADRMFVGETHTAEVEAGPEAEQRVGAWLLSGAALASLVAGLLVALGPGALVLDSALSSALTAPERWLVGIWVAADSFRIVVAEAHRSRHRFAWAAVAGYGLRALLFLALIALVGLVTGSVSRSSAIGCATFASTAALIVSLPTATIAYPWWRHSPLHIVSRVRDHALVVANTLAATAIGGADVWIVGRHFNSSDTAAYALSVTLVGGLGLVSVALSGGLAPRLAAMLAAGETSGAQDLSVRFVRVGTGLVVACYGLLIVVVEPLVVRLGGSAYAGVTPLIAVLGLGQVLACGAGISGWILLYSRHYRESTAIVTAVAVVAVLLEWRLASSHLILATAAASALATASIHLLSNVASQRKLGLRTDVFVPRARLKESAP